MKDFSPDGHMSECITFCGAMTTFINLSARVADDGTLYTLFTIFTDLFRGLVTWSVFLISLWSQVEEASIQD